MKWLIIVGGFLVILTAVNLILFIKDDKDEGDLQQLRKTKYWDAISKIVETDDYTHSELVEYITVEMFTTSKQIMQGLIAECHNSKDVPELERRITERINELDQNFALYTKKVTREAQNDNAR